MSEPVPAEVVSAKRSLVELLRAEPWFVGAGVSSVDDVWRIVVIVNDDANLDHVPSTHEGVRVEAKTGGAPTAYS